MINELRIENFQSHKDSKFKFSPNVNCIIGNTDSGKSAVLRALNWILNNKSYRAEIVRFGADTVEVEAKIEKDIIRKIKSKKTRYELNDEKFMAALPEKIENLLNISEVNIQSQLDAPFLLSKTSGEVTKYLNKIIKFDSLQTVIKKIDSQRNKEKILAENYEKEIRDSKLNLKNLRWVAEYEKDLDKAIKLNNKSEVLAREAGELKCIYHQYSEYAQEIDTYFLVNWEYEEYEKKISKKYKRLNKIESSLTKCIKDVEIINLCKSEEKQSLKIKKINLKKLEVCMKKLEEGKSIIKLIQELNDEILEYMELEEEVERENQKFEKELKQLKKDLQSCPLCGKDF